MRSTLVLTHQPLPAPHIQGEMHFRGKQPAKIIHVQQYLLESSTMKLVHGVIQLKC